MVFSLYSAIRLAYLPNLYSSVTKIHNYSWYIYSPQIMGEFVQRHAKCAYQQKWHIYKRVYSHISQNPNANIRFIRKFSQWWEDVYMCYSHTYACVNMIHSQWYENVFMYYSQTYACVNMVYSQIYATANIGLIRKNSIMRKHAESANIRKTILRILQIFACKIIAKVSEYLKHSQIFALFCVAKISYFVQWIM